MISKEHTETFLKVKTTNEQKLNVHFLQWFKCTFLNITYVKLLQGKKKIICTTWNHGILIDDFELNSQRSLPNFIEKFPTTCLFHLKNGTHLSDQYLQKNGSIP